MLSVVHSDVNSQNKWWVFVITLRDIFEVPFNRTVTSQGKYTSVGEDPEMSGKLKIHRSCNNPVLIILRINAKTTRSIFWGTYKHGLERACVFLDERECELFHIFQDKRSFFRPILYLWTMLNHEKYPVALPGSRIHNKSMHGYP